MRFLLFYLALFALVFWPTLLFVVSFPARRWFARLAGIELIEGSSLLREVAAQIRGTLRTSNEGTPSLEFYLHGAPARLEITQQDDDLLVSLRVACRTVGGPLICRTEHVICDPTVEQLLPFRLELPPLAMGDRFTMHASDEQVARRFAQTSAYTCWRQLVRSPHIADLLLHQHVDGWTLQKRWRPEECNQPGLLSWLILAAQLQQALTPRANVA